MFVLLVVLTLATPEPCDPKDKDCSTAIEKGEAENLDPAILFLIKKDDRRRKSVAKMPVCQFPPNTYWNMECA
jgi:hypothetical protein